MTLIPLFLYIDAETSDYHETDAPSLPVELAALLGDEERVHHTASVILSQRHWEGIRLNPIADRVIVKHGVTPEMCDALGEPPDVFLHQLRRMAALATAVVAHNVVFDVTVIDHALRVQGLPPMAWPTQFCTMRESATHLRIPSGGRHSIAGWKAPRLGEAYRHFVGKELQRAHTALADVYACRAVHRGILRAQRRGAENAPSAGRPGGLE